ncbi:MAG: c-type cytochrome [Taibaiella sp.]|nr:c-type cytochrome [Taibaiella sp.]
MRKWAVLVSCVAAMLLSMKKEKASLQFKVPDGWPRPVYNLQNNPLKKETILLGRALFHDPILSEDSTISCTSCHLQYTAFSHVDHALSHGINDSIGTRNSPTLANLAWSTTFMWDGAVNHLDMQPLAPIAHPAEMASDISVVLMKLRRSQHYPQLFRDAYGDTGITGERFLKAMSQFMVSIVSAGSKYDEVQAGKATFSEQEQKGYRIFKQHCAACHTEPLFTNNTLANNGLTMDSVLRDTGRMKITGRGEDSLLFKVPTLRNVEYSYPYMHDGRFERLQEVIEHYTTGIVHGPTLSPELQKKISLSANDKVDLLAFLLTLTDREFLYDTSYSFPRFVFFGQAKD